MRLTALSFLPQKARGRKEKHSPKDGFDLAGRLGTDFGHLLSIGLNKEEYMKKALPLLLRTKAFCISCLAVFFGTSALTPF